MGVEPDAGVTEEEAFDSYVQRWGGRFEHAEHPFFLVAHRGSTRDIALANGRTDRLRELPPIHFDFINSDITNALAFERGERAYIGLTKGFLNEAVWMKELFEREQLVTAFGLHESEQNRAKLALELLEGLHCFILAHEIAHIHHGHLLITAETTGVSLISEIEGGGLERQALEVDADWSAMQRLCFRTLCIATSPPETSAGEHVYASPGRAVAAMMLAVQLWFRRHTKPGPILEDTEDNTHPPPALRRIFVVEAARTFFRSHPHPLSKLFLEAVERWIVDGIDIADEAYALVSGEQVDSDSLQVAASPEGVAYAERIWGKLVELRPRLEKCSRVPVVNHRP